MNLAPKDRSNCALCKRMTTLRKSHVLPEFLYKEMYDGLHRILQVNSTIGAANKFIQKGIRERLLCDECEQRLSVYEGYARSVFVGGIEVPHQRQGTFIHLAGLHYEWLKLFQLSVLWRASVSGLPMFKQVCLGPHEERVRRMLVDSHPGSSIDYGCIMMPLIHEGRLQKDLMVEPTPARLDGCNAYRFVFGGMVWVYIVSTQRLQKMLEACYLQEDGTCVLRLEEISRLTFLVKTVRKLKAQGKFD